MIKTAICGATGYTGLEILKLLIKHPEVEVTALTAKIDESVKISEMFPEFQGICDMVCDNDLDVDKVAGSGAEVVFLALPHIISMGYAEKFIEKGLKVIDL
ncbi:MAG: N-acetyl-gamma-glutamyl-phosphate reductase, partial [Candidatus Omnitrophota bacterium]